MDRDRLKLLLIIVGGLALMMVALFGLFAYLSWVPTTKAGP